MDEEKHRFTRRYGNIGCMAGLVVSGLLALSVGGGNDAKMRVILVAGVLLGTGIGMFLGRRRDKAEAEKRDAQGR